MGEALAGRRRWFLVAAAAVVLALIVYGVVHALTAGATEEPKAAATSAVDRGDVTTEVATTGTVQPAQTRSLSFAVEGTVESVSVRAGTTVTAGQTLAKVDDDDAAQAVDDAQESLDDAEDALDEAEDDADSTSSSTGCDVAAAYTGGGTSPTASPTATSSPTATATSSPTATKTTTPTTGATTTNGSTSGGGTGTGTGGTAPGGSVPDAGSGTGTGTGSCAGGSTQGGQDSGTDAILSAEQRVNSATTTLEEAEEALEGATITAPIAGKILTVSGKVGSSVDAGSTFITLADVYDMQIDADFPEADADRLAVEQQGVITLADRVGKEFKATVVLVDPTGTNDGTMVKFSAVLSFDEAPEDLLVGQSASVKITTGSKSGVLRVPSTAVHDVQGTKGTVLKGGAQVEVGVGLRGDQYTEITSGLTEGDQVTRSW